MEIELRKKLESRGLTRRSTDWIIKALHPPSEVVAEGVPDQSAAHVLRPDYRVQETIGAPAGAAQWDLMLWSLPGDVASVRWASGPSPVDFTAAATPPGCFTGVIQIQPDEDYAGTATASVLAGSFSAISSSGPVSRPFEFRHQYKSITASLVASAVSDSGSVYAAQFPPTAYVDQNVNTVGSSVVNPSASNFAHYAKFRPPLSESQMTVMAPGAYQGAARDGVYMPHRLAGPSQPFARLQPASYAFDNGNIAMIPGQQVANPFPSFPFAVRMQSSVPGGDYPASWIGAAPMPSGRNVCDTGYDNLNQGVIFFRGLTGGGAGGFPASVRIKVLVGLEIIPSAQTPDRIFAAPSAPYEPKAMEAYYLLCHELLDAYPASYNSAATILSLLGRVAMRLWPVVQAAAPVVMRYVADRTRAGPEPAPPPTRPRVTYTAPQPSTAKVRGQPKKLKVAKIRGGRR